MKAIGAKAILKETFALMGLGILYPTARFSRQKHYQRGQLDTPLTVLIHGYLANPSSFSPLRAYLRAHGIQNIITFGYKSNNGVEHGAITLRDFLAKSAPSRNITLIAHSMGGLVAQTYIQMLGGHRKVRRLITIGTPHQGTFNAYWVRSRAGEEMKPDSLLFSRLAKTNQILENTEITTIIGEQDNIILPRSSAQMGESHYFDRVGHLGLLWSPRVMNVVLQSLKSPRKGYPHG